MICYFGAVISKHFIEPCRSRVVDSPQAPQHSYGRRDGNEGRAFLSHAWPERDEIRTAHRAHSITEVHFTSSTVILLVYPVEIKTIFACRKVFEPHMVFVIVQWNIQGTSTSILMDSYCELQLYISRRCHANGGLLMKSRRIIAIVTAARLSNGPFCARIS